MAPPSALLRCKGRTLDLSTPVVMGVLNVTPDSFSDGGRFSGPGEAITAGLRLAEEGATLIDVGGESTRPGAADVSVSEELRRVIPVLEGLCGRTDALLSVDTSKPEVMREAAAAGAALINDVRSLAAPGALAAAHESGCAVCLMHMQGEPRTMQQDPQYKDVLAEVRAFLAARVAAARAAGFADDQLLVDPGFGFGKTVAHNLTLLRGLRQLTTLGPTVLVGLSRKAMLGKLTGREAGARVYGSVALAVVAALNGARVIRAHDVAATVDALRVVAALSEGG